MSGERVKVNAVPTVNIVGAGPAGAYLSHLLTRRNMDVRLYDKLMPEEMGFRCAWGLPERKIRSMMGEKTYNRHVDPLILHRGDQLTLDIGGDEKLLDIHDLATVDKNHLIRELIFEMAKKNEGGDLETHFGERIDSPSDLPDADLHVDATGPNRTLLGKESDSTYLPAYEMRVDETPRDDFYIKPIGTGYLWEFPLERGMTSVGVGAMHQNPKKLLKDHVEEQDYNVVMENGDVIRTTPPHHSTITSVDGRATIIVGIGEAVGCVSPLSGEGIYPSMKSADLLSKNLSKSYFVDKGGTPLDTKGYVSDLTDVFDRFKREYDVIQSLQEGKFFKTLWRSRKLDDMEEFDVPLTTALKMLYNATRRIKNVEKYRF